jgi:Putative NAD(P)-binding
VCGNARLNALGLHAQFPAVFVRLQGTRGRARGRQRRRGLEGEASGRSRCDGRCLCAPSRECDAQRPIRSCGRCDCYPRARMRPEDLTGAAFVVAASDEEEEECAAFGLGAARAANAIVNAVDRPHLCNVQFGSIVNRSPLVVGTSTDGAPTFAQAVRSRIEALLPRGFAAWAAAAKAWRGKVAATIADAGDRLDFWRLFAERGGAGGPSTQRGGHRRADSFRLRCLKNARRLGRARRCGAWRSGTPHAEGSASAAHGGCRSLR